MRLLPAVAATAITLALCAALPARADALLDRYRLANVAKAQAINGFLTTRVPEMAAVMPELGWDDQIAAVVACTLDGVRDLWGEEGANDYVLAMEGWAGLPVASMADLSAPPPALLTDPLVLEIDARCGGAALGAARMAPVFEMMADPEVMARLMAP